MKRRLGLLAVAMSLLVSGAIVRPLPVRADITFCGGFYGIITYTDWSYGGLVKTFCANSVQAINVPDLRLWAGRDNSITSVKTHNAPTSSHRVCFDSGYSYSGTALAILGNRDIPNLAALTPNVNNLTSSIRTRPTGLGCP